MNKESYFTEAKSIKEELESLNKIQDPSQETKDKKSKLTHRRSEIRELYIQAAKPCNLEDNVEIIDAVGRKLNGLVKDFAIMQTGDVYVSAYKNQSGMKYISRPYKSLIVVNK